MNETYNKRHVMLNIYQNNFSIKYLWDKLESRYTHDNTISIEMGNQNDDYI